MRKLPPVKHETPDAPRVAMVLGGGGARGLAHIVALEALDELGIRPSLIVGTSIGAMVGAAYASGLSAAALKAHVLSLTARRREVTARLMQARAGRFVDLFQAGLSHAVTLDAERILEQFMPAGLARTFDDLAVPLAVVATDYWARTTKVITRGPLKPAVAASIAIPGLVRPVTIDGRMLVDGGAVNPLPFDLLTDVYDVTIAIDVTGGPVETEGRRAMPSPFETMFGALQILMNTLVAEKLKERVPDILIRPPVERFRVLDFLKARDIIPAAEPIKHELKRRLGRILGAAETVATEKAEPARQPSRNGRRTRRQA